MNKILKLISMALLPMMLATGCEGVEGGGDPNTGNENKGDGTGLVASVSPSVIKADGMDAAVITVTFDGKPLQLEDVKFYDDATNSQLHWDSFNYTTITPGTVTFFVTYKTYNTKSTPLTITATPFEVERPADPQPGNTTFVHKSLLIDLTSVKCGYCPMMAATINALKADPNYSDKIVAAALHCSGMGADPFVPDGASAFERAMGVMAYPCMIVDFRHKLEGGLKPEQGKLYFGDFVDTYLAEPAKAGISATVTTNGKTVNVTASVKAAVTSMFRIGAMLLEDGLSAKQTNYDSTLVGDFNTHNHVVRVLDCKYTAADFTGNSLGTIQAGKTSEYQFVWDFDSSWDHTKCSVVLFVTAPDSSGKYYVTNVVEVKSLNSSLPFQYE